ncbi:MAG: trigger factor, partial [Spiroplasma sp.]|nr:trigger factor [Mycoplasmatales bacterium]
ISSIYPDAIDIVLNAIYPKLIKDNKLNVIAPPDFKWDTMKMDENEGFSISGTVELMPVADVEGYKEVSANFKKDNVKVTKADIADEITKLIEHKAVVELKEGKAENGDIAVIDFEGFKDGVAFEGGKGENHPLTLGSNSFIPGFEEQLIGLSAGDSKDVTVTFPAEYQAAELAGKEVIFTCTVHEIKSKKTPKLTVELIKEIKQYEATNKEELEEKIKEALLKQKGDAATTKYNNLVIQALIDKAEVMAPKSMVEQESKHTLEQFKQQIKQQGMEFEMYIQMMGMTEELLIADIDKESKRKIEEMLIMQAVVDVEKIEVTKGEIDTKLNELVVETGMSMEEIKKAIGDDERLKRDMIFDKAYKLVLGE